MPPSRIDELRRRVQNDPASIAFAQLAEEYRRSGQTDEAVRVCREGLTRHPGYLSARVTLGRALLDLGQLAEARGEFEFVVAEAPENLAAVRGLAEIFHRDGVADEALNYYQRALALARHDPEIEEIVQQLSRQVGAAAAEPSGGLSYEEAHQELLSAAERVPLATPASPPTASPRNTAAEGATAPFDFDRLVAALGSPAAPPQVEAAVAGRAVPAIELPDSIDLGPNPFAALEAELRAHDTVAASPETLYWPQTDGSGAGDPAYETFTLDATSADETLPAAAEDAGVWAQFLEPLPAHGSETALVQQEDDMPLEVEAIAPPDAGADADPRTYADQRVEAGEATRFSGLEAFVAEVTPVEPAGAAPLDVAGTTPANDATTSPATEAATPPAKEDVLGDLESWLNSLHDRPAD